MEANYESLDERECEICERRPATVRCKTCDRVICDTECQLTHYNGHVRRNEVTI